MTKRLDEIFKQANENLDRFYDRHGEWDGISARPIRKKEIRRCQHPGCIKRISMGEYCPTHKPEHNKHNLTAKKVLAKFIDKVLLKGETNEE